MSTKPGLIAFTLIGARSTARARANASIAPHEAVATAPPCIGLSEAVPDMNVIDPPARTFGAAYFAAKSAPQKRVSSAGRITALSGCRWESPTSAPAVVNR